MRRRLDLSRLPLVIGALALVIPWAYLGWNTTVGEAVPALRFRTKQTLAGVVQDAAPAFGWHAVLTGQFQQSISRAVGVLSPIFKPAIHWKNQVYYSLFGSSGTSRVVVGRHRELLEIAYLNEYCARDLADLRAKADGWAARIRAMQDFFDARGQAFVYVITPSKVAQYPQFIPSAYQCPAGAEDRSRKLEVYDEVLRRHGVRFVDGASGLAAARARYGINMFPRGGVHWNALAAALATQQVIEAVNRERTTPLLRNFTFTWKVSDRPGNTDRDLLDIMNLPYPDARYPVPVLRYVTDEPAAECHPARITEIGGSFLMGLNVTLEKLDCPPDISYWFYFDHNRFRYVGDKMRELAVDAAERRREVLGAEVVFFEENESALPDSIHGQDFMREVDALRAGG